MSLSLLQQPNRGYLASLLTLPPLIYPFQYNPQQITDSKQNKYKRRDPLPALAGTSGLGSAAAGIGGAASAVASGGLGSLGSAFGAAVEGLGRTFSRADLHQFDTEGDRTISFHFTIDGRETRPGEPSRRRDASGSILDDLAIIRCFTYPKIGDLISVLGALTGLSASPLVTFNEPPTLMLVMGGTSIEGYVTDLKITETQFNSSLDPIRADVDISMIEKIDSTSFIVDSVKRLGRAFYATAYEDVGKVLF
jgi:hypothetical protein